MWRRYSRWSSSSQGMFVLAVLALLIAELRYAEGNKVMAYIFVALGVSLLVRAWSRWRNEKRPS